MEKKRAHWNVKLVRSNLSQHENGELKPQVIVKQVYTLEKLLWRITRLKSHAISPENLEYAAKLLMNEIEDCLVEGSAVNLPFGRLSPGLTGMWQSGERYDAKVRALNQPVVNYAMSPRLRKALADPLLNELDVGAWRRLDVYSVTDSATKAENETMTPGGVLILKGQMLLMNGDLPERGVYLLDAETGAEVAHIRPEEMLESSRRELMFQVPWTMPAGRYRLRVVSQCTTNPRPMKRARVYEFPCELVCSGQGVGLTSD